VLYLFYDREVYKTQQSGREATKHKYRQRSLKSQKENFIMKFEIENYENMTPEEKVAALEAYEFPEPDMSGFVKKTAFDKAASEAASYKKQLREKMSEEEAKAAQAAEEKAQLLERAERAERDLAVSKYVSSYLSMGYTEKLAKSTAEALVKGDMDTVFANQKLHVEDREKALKAEWLKGTPRPAAGGDANIDYNKKIAEAQASGDYTAVAYYTRLAAQGASAND
jgi:hypothetical protein